LHPDIQPLLEPTTPKKGRLSPAVGFSLARVPRDKQLEALALARRPDGRVVKSKVDAVVATMLGHKKSRIRIGRAKRRASIEHALRSIGLGAQKVLSVSTGEAQEIFGELKKGGELEGIDSLEDLLAGLRQMKTGLEAEGPVFEGLPKLKKQATPEEVAEHEMRLHEYWLKRAGPGSGDRLLLALAYPKRRDWKPWVPARNIFPGWESNARPPKTGFTPKAGK
jgi:hypothetical protein